MINLKKIEDRMRIKTGGLITFMIVLWLIMPGCGRKGDKSTFLSPFSSDNREKRVVETFDNKLFRQLIVKKKIPGKYIWKPGRKTEGRMIFTLISGVENPGKFKKSETWFFVKKNNSVIYKLLLSDEFYIKRRRGQLSLFTRKVELPVKVKSSDQLIFQIEGSGNYGNKNFFSLGDIRILSDTAEDFKNLLIISIDTLRADYLGYYVRKSKKKFPSDNLSPNIDKLAEESAIFFNAYTTISSTWPALSSLMTSLMPFDHGVNENGQQLKDKNTLSRILFSKGYYNASFRANSFPLKVGGFYEVKNFFRNDRKLIDWSKNFFRINSGQKFFFWMHLMGVHAGYRPSPKILKKIEPEKYRGKITGNAMKLSRITKGTLKASEFDINHVRNLYSGELLQLDGWLKEIFDLLKKRKIYDKTMIILLADHGEDLFEHNRHFFHHPSIYNSALHIPLLIKFPGSVFRRSIDETVSIMDIMPTILDYFNVESGTVFEGKSLMPLISGKKEHLSRNFVVSESSSSRIFTAIGREWKYIFNPLKILPKTQFGNPYPVKVEEFYNIIKNPSESKHLSGKTKVSVLRAFKSFLFNYIKSNKIFEKRKNIKKGKLSPEAFKELKTLGYI